MQSEPMEFALLLTLPNVLGACWMALVYMYVFSCCVMNSYELELSFVCAIPYNAIRNLYEILCGVLIFCCTQSYNCAILYIPWSSTRPGWQVLGHVCPQPTDSPLLSVCGGLVSNTVGTSTALGLTHLLLYISSCVTE